MLKAKIKNPAALKKITSALKAKGEKVVFTNGCFDLLHYGHIQYLEDAKKKGDILIVAINSDSSLRRIKGKNRPIINQLDRLKTIAALESVDFAVLFRQDSPIRLIRYLRPDILVKGADWKKNDIVGSGFVLGYGGKVATIKLVKNRSTTNLIKKIASAFQNKKNL